MTALPRAWAQKSVTAVRVLGCTAYHRLFAFLHASVMQSLYYRENSGHDHESGRTFTSRLLSVLRFFSSRGWSQMQGSAGERRLSSN